MQAGELRTRELDRLRERKPYWWAVGCTLVSWVGFVLLVIGVPVLLLLPGSRLAQIVFVILALTVAALVLKGLAVEKLLNRWLDRSRRNRTRSDIRELNRRQVYRSIRRDSGQTANDLFWAWLLP
ncbi:hypothetical protein [Plantactinospora endophytica]|uniref:Uncharacterized protein n=1 Tax=Plantactinospora endophytica TaxID=673535 RepID=A0ABQ4E9I7_9ACTN|nr:hypothetical protein [Plantactinospora endophytica]GIG91395.1 hypothetical protein Pen02_63310 [Plantactinospora endophytica]